MLQHFIIEGNYLGSAERKFDLTRGANPLSVLYYCNVCGDPWAKFPVEHPSRGVLPWIAYRMTCRRHQAITHLDIPGSLWLSWDREFTDAFPLAALQWQFLRELEYFERNQNG